MTDSAGEPAHERGKPVDEPVLCANILKGRYAPEPIFAKDNGISRRTSARLRQEGFASSFHAHVPLPFHGQGGL